MNEWLVKFNEIVLKNYKTMQITFDLLLWAHRFPKIYINAQPLCIDLHKLHIDIDEC